MTPASQVQEARNSPASTAGLAKQAEELNGEVGSFIAGVRAA